MINKKPFKLAVITLVCVCLMVAIIPRAKNILELSQRKANLEQQKVLLIEKNEKLTMQFKNAESIENMERIAREQLGMVKEGEQIIMSVIPKNN
ncbi:MAG TPA: septum formation initiator family protein [Syntrophomonadaceae bacterium]|nr:septum formation initiator family protein [Syntrophomonadaceae bacterium]